jgi:hypothetical protein
LLVINPRQLALFQKAAEAGFALELVDYFRARHAGTMVRLPGGSAPLGSLPETVVAQMMRAGAGRARRYGLTGQAAIAGFVAVMLEAAPNFDGDPYLQRYLLDEDVPPNARVDHLLERAQELDWIAVREAYDPAAWEVEGETAWGI